MLLQGAAADHFIALEGFEFARRTQNFQPQRSQSFQSEAGGRMGDPGVGSAKFAQGPLAKGPPPWLPLLDWALAAMMQKHMWLSGRGDIWRHQDLVANGSL